MKRTLFITCALLAAAAWRLGWPDAVRSHETLTTTVLFDREIVRVLNNHCVMCHADASIAQPLETYEQAWLAGRKIRADVISRHMPPWAAVPGYGEFLNDNSLTLRETQFVVSWVEGLGPRNGGTVFTNVVDTNAPPRTEVRARYDGGRWQPGAPELTRQLPATTVDSGSGDTVKRVVVDLGLQSDAFARAVEYQPGDRRVTRAAFFTVQETGQWIGSWTPWHGASRLPDGMAYRIPAGSHVVAELHYRATRERVLDRGAIGLLLTNERAPRLTSDLTIDAPRVSGQSDKYQTRVRLTKDSNLLALRPEIWPGLRSIEVSARTPDGATRVLLFAKDFPLDWPTPYIFKTPVVVAAGTELWLTAYGNSSPPQTTVRLVVSQSAR